MSFNVTLISSFLHYISRDPVVNKKEPERCRPWRAREREPIMGVYSGRQKKNRNAVLVRSGTTGTLRCQRLQLKDFDMNLFHYCRCC
jgi:hypothetical protein